MITLNSPPYSVTLREGESSSKGLAPADLSLLILDDGRQAPTTHLQIEALEGAQKITQVQLQCSGRPTGVHEHVGVIADDTLFVACGPFISALRLPGLEMQWIVQCDEEACLGVHLNEKHFCLVSLGCHALARINFDGTLVWQAMGAEAFTDRLETLNDEVTAVDGKQQRYEFDISTGQPSSL